MYTIQRLVVHVYVINHLVQRLHGTITYAATHSTTGIQCNTVTDAVGFHLNISDMVHHIHV